MGHNLFIHSSIYENYKKLVEKIDKDESYEYFPEKCHEVLSETYKTLPTAKGSVFIFYWNIKEKWDNVLSIQNKK